MATKLPNTGLSSKGTALEHTCTPRLSERQHRSAQCTPCKAQVPPYVRLTSWNGVHTSQLRFNAVQNTALMNFAVSERGLPYKHARHEWDAMLVSACECLPLARS